jgi:ATP-dependent DNA helicase DinG
MTARLDPAEVAALLAPGGVVARRLPGYEPRREQIAMATAVARTLEGGGILVVEAGTGTGKSLAYLVPAILWAKAHGERVVVSTRTINLQEQLVHTDLPFLQRNLGVEFAAALVKGRGNYLCRFKAQELRTQPSLLLDEPLRQELAAILEWAEETSDGSLADLGFFPRSEVWEAVRVEADDCLRSSCPQYENCFFYRARRAAAGAEILVVNHSLLLLDLALRSELGNESDLGILPSTKRLVVDEAHHLEDVATEQFGSRVTLPRLARPLARLWNPTTSRGLLPVLLQKLAGVAAPEDRPAAEGAARWLETRVLPRVPELAEAVANTFEALGPALAAELPRRGGPEPPEEQGLRVTADVRAGSFWRGVEKSLSQLAARTGDWIEATRPAFERIARLGGESAASLLFSASQVQAQVSRVAAAVLDLERFLQDDPSLCRWFELRVDRLGSPQAALCAAPVEVGAELRRILFDAVEAVVLTSATLTVERRFDFFFERTGISALADRVERLRLPSPFRYEDQALLVIPEDLPEPEAPGHEAALDRAIERALRSSRGGAFVLFTSYGALQRAAAEAARRLADSGIAILRQGEADRHTLLERFRRNPRAALFATDSFWEGVDVRGEGLRLVAIARLPFRVPTEPVQQARAEAIAARGGNPFAELGLPQAVIRLRQGFGRLIRSRDDTGAVLLLDSRVVRRRYGETFLESLPPARTIVAPTDIALGELEKFFSGSRS